MRNFIEDYLCDPATAISKASEAVKCTDRFDGIDENIIWQQIATPEFRLYEAIVMSPLSDGTPAANVYAALA